MVKHIVMWKLDESYSEQEKVEQVNEFRDRLLGLKGEITELKSIAVFLNSKHASDANFNIMLDTEFETFADLDVYQVHEKHLKVVAFAKTIKMQRACVDYEF